MSPRRDPAASGPTSGRHSVLGVVTDPGGTVVPTAEVFWIHAEHAGKARVGVFDVHKVATADGDGRFWAPDLPPGTCLMLADFQRLHLVQHEMRIAHATTVIVPTDDPVALSFPRRRIEYGSIHGVVRDQIDRRPGARLHVALVDEFGNVVRETETHTDGRFAFPMLLTPARFKVRVWGSPRHQSGEIPVELALNKRIDFTIDQVRHTPGPRSTVSVTVVNANYGPVAHARVRPVVPGISVAPKATNFDGRVAFKDLPDRPAQVIAEAPGYWPGGVLVEPGAIDETVDAQIQLEAAAQLRVQLRDAVTGRPVRHANIEVKHAGGDYANWGGVLPPPDQPPREFERVPIRPGRVVVRAESPGYARAETAVEVGADDADAAVTLTLEARKCICPTPRTLRDAVVR